METTMETTMETIKIEKAEAKIKQWGHWAFARHCAKLGVDFDSCYYMMFGKYPTR